MTVRGRPSGTAMMRIIMILINYSIISSIVLSVRKLSIKRGALKQSYI